MKNRDYLNEKVYPVLTEALEALLKKAEQEQSATSGITIDVVFFLS